MVKYRIITKVMSFFKTDLVYESCSYDAVLSKKGHALLEYMKTNSFFFLTLINV